MFVIGKRVVYVYILPSGYLKNINFTFSLKIIKEWNAELQERTGKFRKQATAVAEWDKRILQNRDVLLRLEVMHGSLGIVMVLCQDNIQE